MLPPGNRLGNYVPNYRKSILVSYLSLARPNNSTIIGTARLNDSVRDHRPVYTFKCVPVFSDWSIEGALHVVPFCFTIFKPSARVRCTFYARNEFTVQTVM